MGSLRAGCGSRRQQRIPLLQAAPRVPGEAALRAAAQPAPPSRHDPILRRVSGRAELRVAARRAASRGCRASIAIRSSRVEMGCEPNVSAIFPSLGSMFRRTLRSTGSLGSVPPLRRYNGALRLLAVPLASLCFLRSAIPVPATGNDEVSQVPGEPSRACPALRPRRDRPARPSGALPYPCSMTVLPSATTKASAPAT
jgi:hypothetical protein